MKLSALSGRFQIVGFTLTAIYVPFLFLFFTGAAADIETMLTIWPIFPGLALSQLIPPGMPLNDFRGWVAAFLFTLLFVAVSLFGTLRYRQRLWLPVAGVVLASSALVYVMLMLLRA